MFVGAGAKFEGSVEEGAVVEGESQDEACCRGGLVPGLGGVALVVEDSLGGCAAFAEDGVCGLVEDAGSGRFSDRFRFFKEVCLLCRVWREFVLELGQERGGAGLFMDLEAVVVELEF